MKEPYSPHIYSGKTFKCDNEGCKCRYGKWGHDARDWKLVNTGRNTMEKDCSTCRFKPRNMETIGAFCKQGHLSDYLNESIKDCHGWKFHEEIKPDMYSHDSLVHEDELILSYLNSFAYTIKLWVSSKQEVRIPATIDKFACILTAYIHGLKNKEGR